jgi:uncharacterized membrane protein YgcG
MIEVAPHALLEMQAFVTRLDQTLGKDTRGDLPHSVDHLGNKGSAQAC